MRVLNARMLGLVTAALLTIALLFTVPLSDFASARAEARAGDTVAIAGDDDCDVETNDDNDGEDDNDVDGDDNDVDGDDNDVDEDDSVNDEDELDEDGTDEDDGVEDDLDEDDEDDLFGTDDDGDQAQDDDEDNGDGAVVARAGDAVAIAGGCESDSETVETESFEVETDGDDTVDEDTEVVEDDDEVEDRTGDPDGETTETSEINDLLPEGINDLLPEGNDSDGSSTEGTTTARENDFGFGGSFGTGDASPQERTSSSFDSPLPSRRELERFAKIRRFDPDSGADMTLAIRALGLYDVPVKSSNNDRTLDQGLVHVPDTAYPWDGEGQKNVFIAGHRLGPLEKDGRLAFYFLDELEPGDEIVLKDRKGRSYRYHVRDIFKVGPDDAWTADTLVGRDLLTLQTATLPDSRDRLIVRADRVQPRGR